MPILTSPPLLLNSALEPATGTVIVKVTAPIRYGSDQVTRAAAQGRIIEGVLKNAAGDGPLVLAPTPVSGPALEMWFSLNEFRDGRIQQSVSHRVVRVPFVSEVSLDDLEDVELAAADGSYVVPQDVQILLDEITGAGTTAVDAAAAAEVSRLGAEAALAEVPTLTVLTATFVPSNPTLAVTYNGDGSVASTTEDGILTTFTYNGDGTVATQARAGVTKTFSYNASGNVTGAN